MNYINPGCAYCWHNNNGATKIYKGKVTDEPNEWVCGELIIDDNNYYIRQTAEPAGANCGIGKFAVDPESITEIEAAASPSGLK